MNLRKIFGPYNANIFLELRRNVFSVLFEGPIFPCLDNRDASIAEIGGAVDRLRRYDVPFRVDDDFESEHRQVCRALGKANRLMIGQIVRPNISILDGDRLCLQWEDRQREHQGGGANGVRHAASLSQNLELSAAKPGIPFEDRS